MRNRRSAAACLALLLLLLPASLSLASCAMADRLSALIGYDTYDYMGEDVIGDVESGSEAWQSIEEMLPMLTVDSAELPEFDGAAEAQELFRDSLLCFMLDKDFPMYAGNSALLGEVSAEYPELTLLAAIPKEDFESMMYRYFGGSAKLDHKSTELFNYLARADAYVPVSSPIGSHVDFTVLSAAETEHSYRVSFSAAAGGGEISYFALIIKREDGSLYFRTLMHSE